MYIVEIKISRWKEKKRGILLSEYDNFILLRENPNDFLLDGLVFINKECISHIIPIEDKIVEYVLRSKEKEQKEFFLKLKNLDEVFSFFIKHNMLIEFGLETSDYTLVGRIIKQFDKSIRVQLVNINGVFFKEISLKKEIIRVMTIDNDYLKGLFIYMNRER